MDDVPGIVENLEDYIHDLTGADSREIGEEAQEFLQGFVDEPEKLIGPITSIGLGLAGALGALLLMLVTAVFMAANPRPLVDSAVSLVPPPHRDRARADHGTAADLMDRLDAGPRRGHDDHRRPPLHRVHAHRPGLRDPVRGPRGAVHGRPVLRRLRLGRPGGAVRARGQPGKGTADDPHLRGRPAVRGQRHRAGGHGARRQAAPRCHRDRGDRRGPALRRGGADRLGSDSDRHRDPRGRAVGQADGGALRGRVAAPEAEPQGSAEAAKPVEHEPAAEASKGIGV